MFYLLLAIASSTMVSVSMRLSEKRVKNDMGMFIANYLTCVLLSCAFLGSSLLTAGAGFGSAVLQGGFSGFLYLASLFFMQENMHHNGIVLTSAFSKLGVLVPTLMAIVVFRERPEVLQLLGMVVALIAISIIYFEKGAFSQGNKKALLLITLLVSGASDSMANIYDKTGSAAFKDHYLLFTFGNRQLSYLPSCYPQRSFRHVHTFHICHMRNPCHTASGYSVLKVYRTWKL